MMVYPGLLFIMRGEEYWDKPDLFMPERFLDKDLKIKHKEKSGWFPFSIGNRQVQYCNPIQKQVLKKYHRPFNEM